MAHSIDAQASKEPQEVSIMYICICSAVTDGQIKRAVEGGTRNWKALCRELKVAQQCGKCGSCAKQLFDQGLKENDTGGGRKT